MEYSCFKKGGFLKPHKHSAPSPRLYFLNRVLIFFFEIPEEHCQIWSQRKHLLPQTPWQLAILYINTPVHCDGLPIFIPSFPTSLLHFRPVTKPLPSYTKRRGIPPQHRRSWSQSWQHVLWKTSQRSWSRRLIWGEFLRPRVARIETFKGTAFPTLKIFLQKAPWKILLH